MAQLSLELWERATGEPHPDVAGVAVEFAEEPEPEVTIDVTLATDGSVPASVVAAAVPRAVAAAVNVRTGMRVAAVTVHVC